MSLERMTFLDIETVPQFVPKEYDDVPELFTKKFKNDVDDLSVDFFMQKAGLYAEFGRIVCVSIGKQKEGKFYLKSITGHEPEILEKTSAALAKANGILCGHNLIEFDAPFLMRRYMASKITVPAILNTWGKKPWEVNMEDTMKIWGGTQFNYRVSLDLLAQTLGVPSSKENGIDGSQIAGLYYSDAPDREKTISDYCNADVLCCANVYATMKGLPLIEPTDVEYV